MSVTFFKYAMPNPNENTLVLDNAQVISGYTSAMWIERYRDSGEFIFVAPVSSNFRTLLPIGSFISHTGTDELMIVENHEIADTIDGDVNITVSGRSFETWLEQRIIGYGGMDPYPTPAIDVAIPTFYFPSENYADQHIVELINWHCYRPVPNNVHEFLDNIRTVSLVPAETGISTSRELKITDLYKGVIDLLAINDLGIRSVRPGSTSGLPNSNDVGFIIHQGVDKTNTVAFAHDTGDIRNGQYLWTNKQKKNTVFVQGTNWRQYRTSAFSAGYDMRIGYVDATDIDNSIAEDEKAALNSRGDSYLGQSKDAAIVRVEVSPTTNRLRYRQDYSVGDLVAVSGNYNTEAVMRVVEHVEVIDSVGQNSYPTLEAL